MVSLMPSLTLFSSIFVLILYFVLLITDKTISKRMTFVFAVALSFISMWVIPDEYWDLYRHYEFLEDIRNSSLTLREFLLENNMRIGGSDYKSLLSLNVIRYIIAQSGEYRLFPFVMTLTTYSIWGYISHNWYMPQRAKTRELFYGVLVNMVLIPYLFVISGLRNTTAAALVALAFYECRIKEKPVVYAIPLFGMACTIHVSCVYMAVVFFVSFMRKPWMVILSSVIFTQFMPYIAEILSTSNYDYLAKLANSYIAYFMSDKSGGSNMYYVADLFVLIPLAASTIRIYLSNKNTQLGVLNQRVCNIIFAFIAFMVCNIGKNTLVIRSAYTLGVLSVPIVSCYLSEMTSLKSKVTGKREAILFLFVALGFIVVMRYTLAELMLSEWSL